MTGDVPEQRRSGWNDMFVPPEDDPRSQEPVFGERATLCSYLTAYRQTLELKCSGLDAEGMGRRSVPPSDLSLLGLVRHLADVERYWFRRVIGGDAVEGRWPKRAFADAVAEPAAVEEAWTAWREEVAHADRVIAATADLDATGVMRDGERIALREVLVHMVEEYARHCGHADLLRECIDGRVGQ